MRPNGLKIHAGLLQGINTLHSRPRHHGLSANAGLNGAEKASFQSWKSPRITFGGTLPKPVQN